MDENSKFICNWRACGASGSLTVARACVENIGRAVVVNRVPKTVRLINLPEVLSDRIVRYLCG